MSKQFFYIDSQLSRADSTMNRLKRYIRYFSRNYLTDKCIIAGIILILVISVIILVLKVVYPSALQTSVDKVK